MAGTMLFLSLHARPISLEAGCFLSDLLNMYRRYAHDRGWDNVVLYDDYREGAYSSCLEALLWIDAVDAAEELRFEIGVQRANYSPGCNSSIYNCVADVRGAVTSGAALSLLAVINFSDHENSHLSESQGALPPTTFPLGSVEQLREQLRPDRQYGLQSTEVIRGYNYRMDRVQDHRLEYPLALRPILFDHALEDLIVGLELATPR